MSIWLEEDYVDKIYMNFSKVFGTISHERLQEKMKKLRISK